MNNREFNDKLLSLQPNLLNFAYILTSSRNSAYSLVQKATLRALEESGTYRGTELELKPWVFQIMRTLSQGMTERNNHITPHVAHKITGLELSAEVPEGSLSVERVNQALSVIDSERRKLLEMHLKGFTSVEISASTGISVKSVRKTLSGAWQRFSLYISRL